MASTVGREVLIPWIERRVRGARWFASSHKGIYSEIIVLFGDVGISLDERDIDSTALDERILPDASLEQLERIASQMGFPADLYGRESEGIWGESHLRMFISHVATHFEEVSRLKNNLAEYGISAFLAHEDIVPNSDWENTILRALATTDGLVAYLTTDFHQSDWTDQEIGHAMGRGMFIISIASGQTPYGFIGRWQAIRKGNSIMADIASKTVDACLRSGDIRERTVDAMIESFSSSESYEVAKQRIELLEKVRPHLTDTRKNRLKWAYRSNRQLYDCWDVQQQIGSFI